MPDPVHSRHGRETLSESPAAVDAAALALLATRGREWVNEWHKNSRQIWPEHDEEFHAAREQEMERFRRFWRESAVKVLRAAEEADRGE